VTTSWLKLKTTHPFLQYVFLTRIATVDMVLWEGIIYASLVTASYGQYSAHGVATGTTEYAARAKSHQVSAMHSKRVASFPGLVC